MHEFYLMCADVEGLVADLKERSIPCTPVQDQGWGLLTHIILPGGGKLGIYQPRHARPKPMHPTAVRSATKRPVRKAPRGRRLP